MSLKKLSIIQRLISYNETWSVNLHITAICLSNPMLAPSGVSKEIIEKAKG
jgi:hypothetical protein